MMSAANGHTKYSPYSDLRQAVGSLAGQRPDRVGGEFLVRAHPPVRCGLAWDGGHATARPVRDLRILAIHLLITFATLLRAGGVRAVTAKSLLLKNQLPISNRSRQRAPNLTTLDRFVLGLTTLFVSLRRIPKRVPHGRSHLGHRPADSGRACSIMALLNRSGSSKGGLCADCSNHTIRLQGASMVSKYCSARTDGTCQS